ncbi:MAG TPA: hypothetical protein VK588_03075 [Chitinophagaceae bacterium]|nr:hypothetical protein [Chitinophagaceae bacterium]
MIRRYVYLFILIISFVSAKAQQDASACRDKLENFNKSSPFPESKAGEYTSCLEVTLGFFYSIDPAIQKNKERIERLKSGLLKAKNNLSSGTAGKTDSLNYKNMEDASAPEIISLTDSSGMLAQQKDKYKATLKESLNKIIVFFHNTNNPDETVYRSKLDKLNSGR